MVRRGGGAALGMLSALVLAAALLTGRPGAVTGVAVGLAVGAVYASTLLFGFRRANRVGPVVALRLIHAGSFLRLGFAVAAFALAERLLPGTDLTWGAAAALLPLLWSVVRVAHGGADT